MRVLLCDDHAVFAESLAFVLEHEGFDVSVTTSPREAIALAVTQPIDICVLDVHFPDDNGVEAARRMRATAPSVKVVLLTASLTSDLLETALDAGVVGFAHKGQDIADVLRAVERGSSGEGTIDLRLLERSPRRSTARSTGEHLGEFLTAREREVLTLLAFGQSTIALAATMGVAESTARSHVQAVLTKLGVHSRLEAVTYALAHGLIERPVQAELAPRARTLAG